MALCRHGCGTNLTWAPGADNQYRPYGPDGQPHRCEQGLAAYRAAKQAPDVSAMTAHNTTMHNAPMFHATPQFTQPPPEAQPYSAPVERSEVQELRHAVQRLSRAVEMLSEVVQELAARELAR